MTRMCVVNIHWEIENHWFSQAVVLLQLQHVVEVFYIYNLKLEPVSVILGRCLILEVSLEPS